MSTITFDTLKYSKKLIDAGYTPKQAEAVTEAQKEAFNEVLESTLATKQDLKELESNMVKWFAGFMIGQTAVIVAIMKLIK